MPIIVVEITFTSLTQTSEKVSGKPCVESLPPTVTQLVIDSTAGRALLYMVNGLDRASQSKSGTNYVKVHSHGSIYNIF